MRRGQQVIRFGGAGEQNYAGTSPITRQSGKKKTVLARYVHNLGNRLVGILHGCLKTGTTYDEPTAWAHHQQDPQVAA